MVDVNELIKWGLLLLIALAALWLIIGLVGAIISNRAYRRKQKYHQEQLKRVDLILTRVRERHER